MTDYQRPVDDRALREFLIANGHIRPDTRGPEDPTPWTRHAVGVVRLNYIGRVAAAKRVAMGLAGKRDRSFDSNHRGDQ